MFRASVRRESGVAKPSVRAYKLLQNDDIAVLYLVFPG